MRLVEQLFQLAQLLAAEYRSNVGHTLTLSVITTFKFGTNNNVGKLVNCKVMLPDSVFAIFYKCYLSLCPAYSPFRTICWT